MNKLVCFTSISALMVLSSCSSPESDRDPPKLKSASERSFSIFDTVSVEFDEGLSGFGKDNYVSSSPLLSIWSKETPNIVKFVGVKTYNNQGGWAVLPADSSISIAFKGVEDSDGNVIDSLTFRFKTSILADSDFVVSTRNSRDVVSADSLMSSGKFLSGASAGSPYGSQYFAGVLAGANEFGGGRDDADYYRIQASISDSLVLKLWSWNAKSSKSCPKNLLVELLGPKKKGENVLIRRDTAKLNSTCEYALSLSVDANRQSPAMDSTDAFSAPKDYWLRVGYSDPTNINFLPYSFEFARIQKK